MSTCHDYWTTTVDVAQSTLVLVGAATYRIITFMIFLSASIGPSVLVARLYNNVSGLDPMPDIVESAICMLLVSLWAEFSVGCEKRICGDVVQHYKQKYPTTMSFGRFILHFTFYMFAYSNLYIQFEAVHVIRASAAGNDEREAEVVKSQEIHTALFLLALAYLIFVTSRAFHKDLLHAVGNLPVASFSILSNCMLRIGFAILHGLVNALYFFPCIAIAFTAKGYKTPGLTTYFQLTFTAALSGMVGALFELNRPWPQSRGRIPCLFYENNLIGKNLLGHALVVGILVGFYRPFRNPKVPEAKFDSTHSDVIYFCLSVAFTLLHVVKVTSHGILTQAHDLNDRLEQGIVDFDVPNAFLELIDDRPPHAHHHHHHQHQHHDQDNGRSGGAAGSGDSGAGDGGICSRCTANAINNNACGSQTQNQSPPVLTNTNNNCNETRPSRPPLKKQANDSEEVEVHSERTELTTILEEGEKYFERNAREKVSKISRNNNEGKQDTGKDKDEVKAGSTSLAEQGQEKNEETSSEERGASSSTTKDNPNKIWDKAGSDDF